jgi:hypothetical protein
MDRCRQPTINEVINDTLIRTVMHADGVDPAELESTLRLLAARRQGTPSPNPARALLNSLRCVQA